MTGTSSLSIGQKRIATRGSNEMAPAERPAVLFVYYSYTQQTLKVVKAMAAALRERGVQVALASIEFTDPRYADRFKVFPMARPYLDVFGMIPSSLRRLTGTIRIPDVVTERTYDLVCIGSPTWWLSTNMPIRSFLESETAGTVLKGKRFAVAVLCRRYWRHNFNTVRKLGIKRGGVFMKGIHFSYEGGQVRSMLSLISYLGSGEYRKSYLGVKIRPTNLREYQLEEARTFANELADQLIAKVA
jgi:flavodoxin